jgi:glyoxylase-like metal-dependent hydrolase (beta-lactamase superfamily II)
MTMPWEVFAIRYGTYAHRKAQDSFILPVDPHDAPMPIDYFIWLLRCGDREIVVDTGFAPAAAAARKRPLLRTVPEALRAMGVEPATVKDVILTHLHYDHAGNLDQFPAARFHLQDREMGFATGRNMCFACLRHAFDVEDVVTMVRAVYADRVQFLDGDGEVAPGVTLHRVGGHTDGLQMVRVDTARGVVVLASDAAHFYANMERENPFPIVFDVGAMAQGWRLAKRLAGGDASRVVPGHDPLVRTLYPALAGSDGEVVCLHLPPAQ